MALVADKLRVWPFAGRVGLREHNPASGHTDIHVFDQWCHLATVHSDEELADVLQQRQDALAFDLDTYKLAVKHLLPPGKAGVTVLEFGRTAPTAQAGESPTE